jgi:transposase
MPPARRKKRRTGDRALAWRIEHQDSRSGRRLGDARPLSSDGRTGWRQSRTLPLLGELKPASLAADKAYDTNAILQHLDSAGIQAVIPSRANRVEQRPLDEHLYASRNLVERFFCRIKQFRRVATRYDKLSERFSSFVALSAAFIWTS